MVWKYKSQLNRPLQAGDVSLPSQDFFYTPRPLVIMAITSSHRNQQNHFRVLERQGDSKRQGDSCVDFGYQTLMCGSPGRSGCKGRLLADRAGITPQ